MSSGQRRDFAKHQKRLRADTAERLEAIVEAAEKAAEKVIDDAEEQARAYLAQTKAEADRLADGRRAEFSDLIGPLLDQAASLRQEAERLEAALEAVRAGLAPDRSIDSRPWPAGEPEADPPPRLRAVVAGEEGAPPAGAGSDPAGARLLATQMAVSGSSREEIEERLRKGFELEDPQGILDAILGPED